MDREHGWIPLFQFNGPSFDLGVGNEFLDIPFEAAILQPYTGGRMIGGPGDPDIFQHDQIEASLGESWRNISLPRPLGEYSRQLAAQLNYELP